MNDRRRFILLLIIMTLVAISVISVTSSILYRAALNEERERLTESAKSQARLIESVAAFDRIYSKSYPGTPKEATFYQIRAAHNNYAGFGDTGEFTLAYLENNEIVFVLAHRHSDVDNPRPIPWESALAEPMRRALSGQSGTMIGQDYRGEIVLAAYEPVAVVDLGIVAKIDMAEIRKPFIEAGIVGGAIALIIIGMGAFFFMQISNPIIEQLENHSKHLELKVEERTRELRDAQGALIRQERLAVLGELTGGIGHELRHPLGVITNSVYYLKLIQEGRSPEEIEYLDIIHKEAMQAGKIVSDLLGLTRGKESSRAAVSLHSMIRTTLADFPAPANVTVETRCDTELTVYVDASQITQVFNNLVINAYQAMPEGGQLTIEAKQNGDNVEVRVIDTGEGMTDEIKRNLFKPLYTTKSRGIGLGLPVSRKYLEVNGGSISVESTWGEGTTFTVTLPAGE